MAKKLPPPTLSRQSGFTLIEVSMVLIIIGLIIGAVLVGQNLIVGSATRATVAQFERYNAGVNTFRIRYGGLPGDLDDALALKSGFITRSGSPGHGDANGLLEGCSYGATEAGCETLLFWVDLHQAQLVDASYTQATDALAEIDEGEQWKYFPSIKLRHGAYITVFTEAGINYYQMGGITSTDAGGNYTLNYTISPSEGYNMDNKIDDGFPLTGHLRALEGVSSPLGGAPPTPSATTCVSNISGNPYNMAATYVDIPLCHIRVRMQQ